MNIAWVLTALCVVASASAAPQSMPTGSALPGAPAVENESSGPSHVHRVLPAGTAIELELADAVASSRQHRGDRFGIRVAEAVLLDGVLLIPAGTTGVGEVVHAAPSGGGGKAGELILAARSLDLHGRIVALRGLKLGGSGKDTSRIAIAVGAGLGPFAMFVHGHEIEIPAGTRAHAKLASDYPLDDAPAHAVPSATHAPSSAMTGDAAGDAPAPIPTPDPDN